MPGTACQWCVPQHSHAKTQHTHTDALHTSDATRRLGTLGRQKWQSPDCLLTKHDNTPTQCCMETKRGTDCKNPGQQCASFQPSASGQQLSTTACTPANNRSAASLD